MSRTPQLRHSATALAEVPTTVDLVAPPMRLRPSMSLETGAAVETRGGRKRRDLGRSGRRARRRGRGFEEPSRMN